MEKGSTSQVTISEALNQLEAGPCDISVIKADISHKRAGEIVHYKQCRIALKSPQKTRAEHTNPAAKKAQHHWMNATRNITLQNGQFRKIHIHLIYEIDNKKVL